MNWKTQIIVTSTKTYAINFNREARVKALGQQFTTNFPCRLVLSKSEPCMTPLELQMKLAAVFA